MIQARLATGINFSTECKLEHDGNISSCRDYIAMSHLSLFLLAAGVILALVSVYCLVTILPPPTKCDSEEKSDADNCPGKEVYTHNYYSCI